MPQNQKRSLPSIDRIRQLLSYDQDTGVFIRIESAGNVGAGRVAGHVRSDGYRAISIDGKDYKAHRLAWLLANGREPTGVIDHINGNPSDNRLTNLRDVPLYVNAANREFPANKHGLRGVNLSHRGGGWIARIGHNGVRLYLGTFPTKEAAYEAYRTARKSLRTFPEVPPPDRYRQPRAENSPTPSRRLTQVRLMMLLTYYPETGLFGWNWTKSNREDGKRAGYADNVRGYRYINIDRKRYYEHRLAWFYMTGEWPANEIDHINGVTGDNRFVNLRPATSTQNKRNRRGRINSASGLKGVSRDKRRGTWSFDLTADHGRIRVSGFETAEAAHAAYLKAAMEHHGEFARLT